MPGYTEGNVFFIGDFDDQLEQIIVPLTSEIKEQSKRKNGRIDLHINSYGGYLHLVRNFVDLVELAKRNDVVVRTIVSGVAYSAGSMLAVAGTPGERYIAKHAEHLIHYGQAGSIETTPGQVERSRASKHRSFKQILDHYREYCNIPNLEGEILDDGWYIEASKCLKYGIADKYTSKLEL
jgi:ATP-dependent protease ClpP protease subunit